MKSSGREDMRRGQWRLLRVGGGRRQLAAVAYSEARGRARLLELARRERGWPAEAQRAEALELESPGGRLAFRVLL